MEKEIKKYEIWKNNFLNNLIKFNDEMLIDVYNQIKKQKQKKENKNYGNNKS